MARRTLARCGVLPVLRIDVLPGIGPGPGIASYMDRQASVA